MTAPRPPTDLADRVPEVVIVARGTSLHRFYTERFEPIFFDRSRDGRLNAANGDYGVLYAAQSRDGAFAETFLRTPGASLIDADLLARKAYVRIEAAAELRMIKLGGPGLAILGATAEVTHGGLPYDNAQAWSEALRNHPARADGVAYYARHDDEELCYAIFDRAAKKVREVEKIINLDQDWFWRIANKYRVGLAPP